MLPSQTPLPPVMISAQPGGEPAGLATWANLIPTGYQPGPRTKPKLIIWFPQFFIILHSLQLIFPRCLDILPCQCELQFGLRHHHCCLLDDVCHQNWSKKSSCSPCPGEMSVAVSAALLLLFLWWIRALSWFYHWSVLVCWAMVKSFNF